MFTAPHGRASPATAWTSPAATAIPAAAGAQGQAFIDASDESDPIYDYRNLGAGALGGYALSRTPPAPVSWIALNASCDGQRGPCPAGHLISRISGLRRAVVLDDPTHPTRDRGRRAAARAARRERRQAK